MNGKLCVFLLISELFRKILKVFICEFLLYLFLLEHNEVKQHLCHHNLAFSLKFILDSVNDFFDVYIALSVIKIYGLTSSHPWFHLLISGCLLLTFFNLFNVLSRFHLFHFVFKNVYKLIIIIVYPLIYYRKKF